MAALVLLATALPGATPAWGQSTAFGSLSGMVTGTDGAPLDGVDVTLLRAGEETERTLTATREGYFQAGYLAPGQYDLVVERFGFVPVRVRNVILRTARQAVIQVTLRETEPPVTETDTYQFSEVGRERSLGAGRGISRSELQGIPIDGRELSGIMSRWTRSASGAGVMGMPAHLTGLSVDGMRHEPVFHPRIGPGFLHLTALSPLFLQEVELAPQSVDVEQGGSPGARLRATTIQGGNTLRAEAFGNAFGTPMGADGPLGSSVDNRFGPEVGALVHGPIIHDTLHFAFGLEARRAARTLSPLAASSGPQRSSFLEAIGDAERPAGERLGVARVDHWDVLSTFGRMDWRLGQNHTLTLRSNVSVSRPGDDETGPTSPIQPSEGSDASDVMISASLFSVLGERSALEVRAGAESSSREYGGASGPGGVLDGRTWIQEGGIVAGSDPTTPGRFEERAFRLAPTFHIATRSHRFKFGIEAASRRYEEESMMGPARATGFPDLQAFQDGRGLAVLLQGPRRAVEVDRTTIAAFVQDRWTPTEGLTITAGLRADGEGLPFDEVMPSEQLAQIGGVSRAPTEDPRGRVSPRLGVEWSPGTGPGWTVEGSAGIYHGEVHPGVLAEVLAETGEVSNRRTLGVVGGGSGSSTALVSEGSRISVLGPRFDAPRTQAVDLAVRHALTPGLTVEVGLGHRQTDFLPRRRDLNRVSSAFATDQFGRPLFGEVIQHDGVISIRPGSDRRFAAFDVISALESDGSSTWTGVTSGISYDGNGGPLSLEAWYTFSETRDNVPQGITGWPVHIPGRPGPGGALPGWIEGRSDMDVPHRAVLSGEMQIMESPGLRLGALYGFQSGTPFTPTVRDLLHGSDPLGMGPGGTGSGAPISLPSGMDGLDQVLSRASCLNDLVGAPRTRNSCRTEGIHDLKLRMQVTLGTGTGWDMLLNVDALNLLDSGPVIPDPALFVVDGGGELNAPVQGRLNLPVTLNEHFGEPLVRLSPGRSLRIGIGIRY